MKTTRLTDPRHQGSRHLLMRPGSRWGICLSAQLPLRGAMYDTDRLPALTKEEGIYSKMTEGNSKVEDSSTAKSIESVILLVPTTEQ